MTRVFNKFSIINPVLRISLYSFLALMIVSASKVDVFADEIKETDLILENGDNSSEFNPSSLYPSGLFFDVYRKGDKIGSHEVQFNSQGNTLVVISEFRLRVKLMFVVVYRHFFKSVENWTNNNLISFKSEENENGKKSSVNAGLKPDGFFTEGRKGYFESESWHYPSTHWDMRIINSTTILNAITGKLNKVKIINHGFEEVAVVGGMINAERYEYTGELRNTNVWYDKTNRWVRMVFTTKKGDTITYLCRECGLDS
mgnify:CR=1 FL=1